MASSSSFCARSLGLLWLLYLCVTAHAACTDTFQNCTPENAAEAGNLEPVPLFDTAAVYAGASARQDSPTLAQIRNTLSLYPLAVDGKNFDLLRNVFFQDAIANYSAPLNILTPLPVIEKALAAALASVTTQHLLGTQVVELSPGGRKAKALTYFTATHFGKNQYEGQILQAYGQYQDILAKDKDSSWKIQIRNLQYMVGLAVSGIRAPQKITCG